MRLFSQLNRAVSVLAILCVAGNSAAQPPRRPAEPTVEGLTVTPPIAPVPQVGAGAPMLTIEELAKEAEQAHIDRTAAVRATNTCDPRASMRFALQPNIAVLYEAQRVAEGLRMGAADAARQATEEAVAARIAAAKGEASQAEIEQAELKRQVAVMEVLRRQAEAITAKTAAAAWQEVSKDFALNNVADRPYERMIRTSDYLNPKRVSTVAFEEMRKLQIIDVKVSVFTDQDAWLIEGRVRNPEARAILFPTLSFTSPPMEDGQRTMQVFHPRQGEKISAKGSAPFSYTFFKPPHAFPAITVEISDGSIPPELLPVELFCGPMGAPLAGRGGEIPSRPPLSRPSPRGDVFYGPRSAVIEREVNATTMGR